MYGQNVFTGVIDESGVIWDFIGGRKNKQVGIDSQKESELLAEIEELKEITDNYYNKLVELGVITPPKTAEEIAREQMETIEKRLTEQTTINTTMLDALQKLTNEIGRLKEEAEYDESVRHDNKQSSANARKKSTANKKSN